MVMTYPEWSTTLNAAPAVEPISLLEAKLHLRVEHTSDDALITALISAARLHCEAVTDRAFITQTWDLTLDAFPCEGPIWLPRPPVSSVASVTYLDSAGAPQTWAAENYRSVLPFGPWAQRGFLTPAYGVTYPTTREVIGAVTVRCVCGYGGATAVPESIKAAIKLLVAHWYENREAASASSSVMQSAPLAVDALLSPFKAH